MRLCISAEWSDPTCRARRYCIKKNKDPRTSTNALSTLSLVDAQSNNQITPKLQPSFFLVVFRRWPEHALDSARDWRYFRGSSRNTLSTIYMVYICFFFFIYELESLIPSSIWAVIVTKEVPGITIGTQRLPFPLRAPRYGQLRGLRDTRDGGPLPIPVPTIWPPTRLFPKEITQER